MKIFLGLVVFILSSCAIADDPVVGFTEMPTESELCEMMHCMSDWDGRPVTREEIQAAEVAVKRYLESIGNGDVK